MLWFRSLLFLILVPGTVLGLIPGWLLARGWAHTASFGIWRLLGVPISVGGLTLMLWCFLDFVRRGRGTPAPVDPPRQLVREGPYRWVRNPMYVAGVVIVLGEALLWEAPWLLLYLAGFWSIAHVFVVAYEERALAGRFGEEYRRYQQAVPRWIPRAPQVESPTTFRRKAP